MNRWRAAFFTGVAIAWGGCASNSGVESEGGEESSPEVRPAVALTVSSILGEITYVNRDGGFVLIETTVTPNLELGEKLEVRSVEGAPSGELVLSPERKRSYLIGDIISGYPQVADRVYFQSPVFPDFSEEKERSRDKRRGSKSENSGPRRFGGR